MGFFRRLANLIRGFFSLFIGGLEEKNPDLLYEDIKIQIEKARKEAEQQIVEIQTSAELIKMEMRTYEKNLQAIRQRIEAAQRTGDKEVLVELLIQEEEYSNTYETHKATYDIAIENVIKIREDYKLFESEMNTKLHELKSMKSQAKIASLKENINSVNAKYSSRDNSFNSVNSQMERMREIVNKKTAKANAVESLEDNSMETRIKKLDINSARSRAQARAEAMLGEKSQSFEVKEKVETNTTESFEIKENPKND